MSPSERARVWCLYWMESIAEVWCLRKLIMKRHLRTAHLIFRMLTQCPRLKESRSILTGKSMPLTNLDFTCQSSSTEIFSAVSTKYLKEESNWAWITSDLSLTSHELYLGSIWPMKWSTHFTLSLIPIRRDSSLSKTGARPLLGFPGSSNDLMRSKVQLEGSSLLWENSSSMSRIWTESILDSSPLPRKIKLCSIDHSLWMCESQWLIVRKPFCWLLEEGLERARWASCLARVRVRLWVTMISAKYLKTLSSEAHLILAHFTILLWRHRLASKLHYWIWVAEGICSSSSRLI